MPNKPRPENRHRMVRVEDELWEAARVAAAEQGTTRAAVMREALRRLVDGSVVEEVQYLRERVADLTLSLHDTPTADE